MDARIITLTLQTIGNFGLFTFKVVSDKESATTKTETLRAVLKCGSLEVGFVHSIIKRNLARAIDLEIIYY